MTVKLIMTWDIRSGREQEYFEFIGRSFMPAVIDLGVEMKDAWLTIYGERPQILVSAVMPDFDTAWKIIETDKWRELTDALLDFVDNFEEKIVQDKGAFQF